MLPEPQDHGPRRGALILLIALVLLPGLPTAWAHGGEDDGHDVEAPGSDPGNPFAAFQIAVREGDHDQRNPSISGDLVVWQERVDDGHRGWDIFAANLTARTTFTVYGQAGDQVNPRVDGQYVVWEDRSTGSSDVVLLDLEEGRLRTLAGSAQDEQHVDVSWPYVVWTVGDGATGTVGAYDLSRGQHVRLPANITGVHDVATWGGHIAWVERADRRDHIVAWTDAAGTPETVHTSTFPVASLSASDVGIAWLSRSQGLVTHVQAWDRAVPQPIRTSITPHANVRACPGAVVWDQGSTLEDQHGVAYWFARFEKVRVFVPANYVPDCSSKWIVFEKRLDGERAIFAMDAEANRPTVRPQIVPDEGMQERIVSGETRFTGEIWLHDPDAPIVAVRADVDEVFPVPVEVRDLPNGSLRWRVTIDVSSLSAGEHRLGVVATTSRGDTSAQAIRFYADTQGTERAEAILQNSAYEPPPPPADKGLYESLTSHYSSYTRFYNTVFLVVVVVLLILRWVVQHRRSRPRTRPEYVRADQP